MFLRNVVSVGWDFCIMRIQHGSVANTCAKTFIDTLQKSLFICYLLYTEMGAELINLAFFRLLFALFLTHASGAWGDAVD
jgi:hypothetical protein